MLEETLKNKIKWDTINKEILDIVKDLNDYKSLIKNVEQDIKELRAKLLKKMMEKERIKNQINQSKGDIMYAGGSKNFDEFGGNNGK